MKSSQRFFDAFMVFARRAAIGAQRFLRVINLRGALAYGSLRERYHALVPKTEVRTAVWKYASRALVALVAFAMILPTNLAPTYATGLYTTSATDADGNALLANNGVFDTVHYDTGKDSSADTQRGLGIDPNWANGVSRESGALKFDGSNDKVELANTNGSVLGNTDASVSVWFRPSAFPGVGNASRIFSHAASASTNRAYISLADTSTIAVTCGANTFNLTAAAQTGTWYHVVLTMNRAGGVCLGYLNGAYAANTSSYAPGTGTVSVVIGTINTAGDTEPFAGVIDDVRVYKRLLSADEAQKLSARDNISAESQTLHLAFDEQSGTVAADGSSRGNDGTLKNGASNSPAADGTTNGPIWVSGANAIMDGFKGCGPEDLATCQNPSGKPGAGNVSITADSSTTSDNGYEIQVRNSPGLQFDGVTDGTNSDYAFANDNDALDVGTSSATWSAWFSTSSTTNLTEPFIRKTDGNYVNGMGIGIGNNSTSPFACVHGGSYCVSAPSATYAGTGWHLLTAVFDRTAQLLIVYVDGAYAAAVSTAAISGATDLNSTGALIVGGQVGGCGGTCYFAGKLDDLRFFKRALSASEVANLYAGKPVSNLNLNGWWKLDEGSGTSAADSSGNGISLSFRNGSGNSPAADGSANGPIWVEGARGGSFTSASPSDSPSWALDGYQYREQLKVANGASALPAGYSLQSPVTRSSKLDALQTRADGNDWRVVYQPSDAVRSLSFDGVDDRTVLPATAIASGTGAYTVSAWANASVLPTTGVFHMIATFGSASSNAGVGVGLLNSSGIQRVCAVLSNNDLCYAVTMSTNAWHHYAATYSGGTLKLFIDGVEVASGSRSPNIVQGSSRIGAWVTGAYQFTGYIDDVRIHTQGLTGGEISALYGGGTGTPNQVGSGLRAWWRLDEGSGQILRDSSGNGHHGYAGSTSGSDSDDPSWSTFGAVSTSYEVPRYIPQSHFPSFDRVDDMAEVAAGDVDAHDIRLDSMSWSVWFRTTVTSSQDLLRKSGSNAAGGIIMKLAGTNNPQCVVGSTNQVTASATVSGMQNGAWHHMACVLNRQGNLQVYIDGALAAESSAAALVSDDLNSSNPLRLSPCTGGACFGGGLQGARVYRKALSRDDIARIYAAGGSAVGVAENGLIAGWRMDEGTGTSIADYSGGGYPLTLSGSVPWELNQGKLLSSRQTIFAAVAPIAASATSTDYFVYYGNPGEPGSPSSSVPHRTGINIDSAFSTSQRVGAAASNSYILGNTGTVSIWAKFDSLPASTHAVAQLGTGNNYGTGFLISQNASNLWFYWGANTTAVRTTGNPLTTGVWYHIVYSMSSGTPAVYINGAAASLVTDNPAGTISTAQELYFGGNATSAWAIDGTIDDARVYSRALSAAEAADSYSNASPVSESGLVGHWKMDEGAGSAVADSSSVGNHASISSSNFDSVSGWVLNENLLDLANAPTLSANQPSADMNEPWWFQARTKSGLSTFGSWSALMPMSSAPTSIATGVKVKFNQWGSYSRLDKFNVASWAVEAYTTSSPQRGKRRSFPAQANIVLSTGGVDIIDAQTNKLWMRVPPGANASTSLIYTGDYAKSAAALNGRLYIGKQYNTNPSIDEFQFDLDNIRDYRSAANNRLYQGGIAQRAGDLGFETGTGTGPYKWVGAGPKQLSVAVVNGKQYMAAGSSTSVPTFVDVSVVQDITAISPGNRSTRMVRYGRAADTFYGVVQLTSQGALYAANVSAGGVDRWDSVQSDTSDQLSGADRSYILHTGTATSTDQPALRDATVNSLSVSEGTSSADYASNTLAVGTNAGVDVINEHSTLASTTVTRHGYVATSATLPWSSQQFGAVAEFDGSDDRVTMTDAANLSPGSGDMTVEAWIKLDAITGAKQTIFNNYGSVSNNVVQFIVTQTGKVQCSYRDAAGLGDSGAIGATTLSANTWYHVACVKGGGSRTVYLNGVADATDNTAIGSVTTTGGAGPSIGRNASFGEVFDGMIDELRISNSARYTGGFSMSTSPFTSDANTVLLYHFNGPSGQTVADDSGNLNPGTLGSSASADSADPLFVSPSMTGAAKATAVGLKHSADTGRGLSFDGTDDVVNIPDVASLQMSTAISLSGWFRPATAWPASSGTEYHAIISKANGGTAANTSYALDWSGTSSVATLRLFLSDGTNTHSVSYSTGALVPGRWYHVAGTWTQGKGALYLDGTQVATNTNATVASIQNLGATVKIGGNAYGVASNYCLEGGLDDVRAYNRQISAAEVMQMWNGGRGWNGGLEAGLVGAWNLNEGGGQTVADYSGNGNTGTLGSSTTVGSDDPTWISSTPVREQPMLWIGSNGTGSNDGGLTAASLVTNRRVATYTTSNSILPDNDISSISVSGGLALVGTEVGAWNPGAAGIIMDDLSALLAGQVADVRVKGGTTRVRPGTTRVR